MIEDNAHGLFGSYRDRPLGALGQLATLSFHETKNFICGEGGALIVNDERFVDRADLLYDKGTNRRRFMLGQVDKYSWQDLGSSFGLSEVLAAYLYGQLEQREVILTKRRALTELYRELITPTAEEFSLQLPIVPDRRDQAYHMFYVLLPDRPTRDAVLESMRQEGVYPTFHYVPLHSPRPPARSPRPATPSARSPTTSAVASCASRSTTTCRWKTPSGWSRSSGTRSPPRRLGTQLSSFATHAAREEVAACPLSEGADTHGAVRR